MNNDELKRIMEVYRTGDHDYHRRDIANEHAGILADAFLEEHPPDEDEPITPEWLNGLLPWDDKAFDESEPYMDWEHLLNGHELIVATEGDFYTLSISGNLWPIPFTTRGQLRRLLSALEE